MRWFLGAVVAAALVLVLDAAPAGADTAGEEFDFLDAANRERAAAGVRPLAMSTEIRDLSRAHSAVMSGRESIFHRSPLDTGMPSSWQRIGENVGVGEDVRSLHDAFMASPAHRANVVNGAYNYVGMGIVRNGTSLYITQIFMQSDTAVPTAVRPVPVEPSPFPRLAGADRSATSIEVSRAGWADGTAPVAVLASGTSYTEALPASVLAAQKAGPLLLSTAAAPTEALVTELRRLGTTTVLSIGSVPPTVDEALRAGGFTVGHIGTPDDVVETAAQIASAISARPSGISLVNLDSFADGISAAALSAGRDWPILFTTRDGAPPGTLAAWEQLGRPATSVVGGSAVVSDAVVAQFGGVRLAGGDRYGTSTAVASRIVDLGGSLEDVFAATGTSFPDALAGGPLVARRRGVTLLVDGSGAGADGATRAYLAQRRAGVGLLVILGGHGAVNSTADQLLQEAVGR